jgi:autotransporter-associated beta strand protein
LAGDQNFSTPGNWQGGVVPPSTGADSAQFAQSSYSWVNIGAAHPNFSGLVFQSSGNNLYTDSTGTLTIGSGGISVGSGYLELNVPIILSASQTWAATSNWIESFGASISETGGPATLTTSGSVYLYGTNTFSGGLKVSSGFVYLGSAGAAGTGLLTLSDNTYVEGSSVTIPNPVSLGNNVTLGQYSENNPLNFSGTVTAVNAATTLNIGYYGEVALSGSLTGPASPLSLSIVGNSSMLPNDAGSLLVMEGTLNNVSAVSVSNASLILAPATAPGTAFASLLAAGLQVGNAYNKAYLGLDGMFTTGGAVSSFLTTYGPSIGPVINGALGFDTFANPSSPNVFIDPIDLSSFSSGSFLGLGSATAAILGPTAVITPYNNAYLFGGGGGTLTVQSALADNGVIPRSLTMSVAPEPLTLDLQGSNTYTGGTTVEGGILIFNSPWPSSGTITLNGSGYAGYTENADSTAGAAQAFVSQIQSNSTTAVIGFDSADPSSPRTINDSIDLSGFNSENNPFIGTATAVTLNGLITPANNQYQFTGVKGGRLTVSSNLTDISASAVIGLPNPVEAGGTISTVTLSGTNTYTQGTVLNSGALFINNGSALGTGTISIPATNYNNGNPPSLAPYGGTVTLGNPISVGAPSYGPAIELGNYGTSDMLVLNGIISDYPSQSGQIGIQGPVTINGTNTYSGGTVISGNYSGNTLVYIGNNSAFGTGQINVGEPSTFFPDAGGPVILGNPILLNNTLTLGASGNPYLLTLNGIISSNDGNGLMINGPVALNGMNTFSGLVQIMNAAVSAGNPEAFGTGEVQLTGSSVTDTFTTPSYLDLTGDSTSSINLVPNSTLTLNTDNGAAPAIFNGNIIGDSTDQVVVAGTGIQALFGNSTYGGGTTVTSGAGLIAGSATALGTGPVNVAAGAELITDTGVVLANALTLNTGSPGSEVGGNGTFSPSGGVVVSGGIKISPGADGNIAPFVGNLSFGSQLTLGPGGIYAFDVENAGGVAGTDYDTVNVSGALVLTATSGSPFQIALTSINPSSGTAGLATFNSSQTYSWTLVSAGSISGFDPTAFTFNTSGFQNLTNGGSFSVSESGASLDLNFTPVPEPSTWALMLAGAAALGTRLRKSKRS